ncbi:hypothetical protein XCR1_1430009 [Xenorhabdus cabanillasii JM26]|uniref:Uncharacterized protein n=1 Tax=Xenorhabdus cabanillasii JM26 TaxID=1427517 RepID=W1IP26_9GAMM|nr:hypothetical protein XCR1_1430009 [Xenorhabdus cabanillasii JM26]
MLFLTKNPLVRKINYSKMTLFTDQLGTDQLYTINKFMY